MPIYDYTCGTCGHTVEVIHGIHEGGPRFCPSCGVQGGMKKAFNAPTIHFKGSGWAKKDRSATASPSRSKGKDAAAGSDGAGGGSVSEGTTGSADGAGATSTTTTPASSAGSGGGTTGSTSTTGPTAGGE